MGKPIGASGYPVGIAGLQLINAVYKTGFVGNAGTGNIDLYTAPAGKRALIRGFVAGNSTGGSLNATPQVKISATYYNLGALIAVGATGFNSASVGFVLEPGESFAVLTSGTGLNLWATIIEYDSATPLFSARLTSFSTGDNTLYTVTTGKSAQTLTQATNALNLAGQIMYWNNSGGARTYSIYSVANGGSKGSTNQLVFGASLANATTIISNLFSNISSGDFIVINVDAGTATQFAFMTVAEI